MPTDALLWRTGCACNSDNCVEVARQDDSIGVRDSKDSAGPKLDYTSDVWQVFICGIKTTEFDAFSYQREHQ
jgi:hypothetical protein